MAVRKLRKAWWADFRFNNKRYRKKSPDNSRAGAQIYEAQLRQKLARGESIDNKVSGYSKWNDTFRKFSSEWFELYVKTNNKPSEIRSKKYILYSCLIPYFGKTPIDQITSRQIERYKKLRLDKGLAPKTINNHLTVLAKCIRTAEEWRGLENSPRIKKLKTKPSKYDFLTERESRALLNAADGIWHELILTALKTGLRFGELRALYWQDIDWDNKILSVRRSMYRHTITSPKSNKERHIPLTSDVLSLLHRRKESRGYIFLHGKGGAIVSTTSLYHLHRICDRAGLRKVGWHTLRHTFASRLAARGVPLVAIKELMGHADVQTTMRYAHLAQSALKEAMSVLEPEGVRINFGQPVVNAAESGQLNGKNYKGKNRLT